MAGGEVFQVAGAPVRPAAGGALAASLPVGSGGSLDAGAGGGVPRELRGPDAESGSASGSTPTGPPGSGPPSASGGRGSEDDGRPSLPQHRLLRRIGKGGFGEVWLGEHRDLDVFVAVKIVPAADPAKQEEELRGLRKLKQVVPFEGRRHLVWIEEVGRTEGDGALYCVMELADPVARGPLRVEAYEPLGLDHRLKQGRVGPEEARAIALDIAMGLAFLRAHGLEHGDLKPGNVLRVQDRWKLSDYSTLGSFDRRSRYGSKSWRPKSGSDAEVDQFALGVILHQLGTSRMPGPDAGPDLWASDPKSRELRRICLRMLQQERSLQYPHLSDAVSELERIGRPAGPGGGGSACPACGSPVAATDEFCGSCSSALTSACAFCDASNAVGRSFCGKCGGPIEAWSKAHEELRGAEQLVASERDGEARERIRASLEPLLAEILALASRSAARGGRSPESTVGVLREKAGSLRREVERRLALDEELAEARASGDPERFEHVAMRASRAEPNCRRFAVALAEAPRYREQVQWQARLAQLGHPHRAPRELSDASLAIALHRIRGHAASDVEVRRHVAKVVDLLDAERLRRRRREEHRSARMHLDAGRPLEALICLRRIEAAGAADERTSADLARLSSGLRDRWVPDLKRQARELLAAEGFHRRIRRLERILKAIEPEGGDPLPALGAAWRSRRRRWIVQSLVARAETAGQSLDAIGVAMNLDRAAAVAGRAADLAGLVDAAHARFDDARQAVQRRWSEGSAAMARRRAKEAVAAFESAVAMAPRVAELQQQLQQARHLERELPRRRRRALILGGSLVALVATVAAAAGWQFLEWRRIGVAAEEAAQVGGREGRERLDRVLAEERTHPLSRGAVVRLRGEELRRKWAEWWLAEHRASSPFQPGVASGLEELASWVESDPRNGAVLSGDFERALRAMLDAVPGRPLSEDPLVSIDAGCRSHAALSRIRGAAGLGGGSDWGGWLRRFSETARPPAISGELQVASARSLSEAIAVLAALERASEVPEIEPYLRDLRGRFLAAIEQPAAAASRAAESSMRSIRERLIAGRWHGEPALREELLAIGPILAAYAALPGEMGGRWQGQLDALSLMLARFEEMQRPRLRLRQGRMELSADDRGAFDPGVFEFVAVLSPGSGTPVMLVARTEATEAQRAALFGTDLAPDQDAADPWVGLTIGEARSFCDLLSERLAGLEIGGWRWKAVLPTHPQWRAAAEADDSRSWVDVQGHQPVDRHPEGASPPEGLWHLHGNVREWGGTPGTIEAFGGAYSDSRLRRDWPARTFEFIDDRARFPHVGVRVFLVPLEQAGGF